MCLRIALKNNIVHWSYCYFSCICLFGVGWKIGPCSLATCQDMSTDMLATWASFALF